MRFVPLPLAGAFRVESERHADERGAFARAFCAREFADAGLDARVAQTSLSWNPRRGTLRGLHWQAAPHGEAKLVRCLRGRILDVIVDLRSDSATALGHVAIELGEEEPVALYLPPGFAHGFLTLAEETLVHYQMSVPHAPASARGARYDDPAFGIAWPDGIELVSERDRSWPDFVPGRA